MVGIVGGGIIGLAIAWRLAQQGVGVRVFNSGRRGGEASPAGAGMLAPGGEFTGRSIWSELGMESHALYPAFVEELTSESGVAIDFRLCGAIEQYIPSTKLDAQQGAGIVFSECPEGIFYPQDGYVDPRHVLEALRTACERRNVTFVDGHTVTTIDAEEFEALVIAAGAWSGELEISAEGKRLPLRPTVPIKGHLIGYRLPPDSLGPIRRHGHTYLLQRASGFTIAGSTEEKIGFDTKVDDRICREIHARAVKLWPTLAAHSPSECWIGFRPATEDLLPQIGRIQDSNVWCAYGHYRNGILLAPVTAQRVAQEITSSLGKG